MVAFLCRLDLEVRSTGSVPNSDMKEEEGGGASNGDVGVGAGAAKNDAGGAVNSDADEPNPAAAAVTPNGAVALAPDGAEKSPPVGAEKNPAGGVANSDGGAAAKADGGVGAVAAAGAPLLPAAASVQSASAAGFAVCFCVLCPNAGPLNDAIGRLHRSRAARCSADSAGGPDDAAAGSSDPGGSADSSRAAEGREGDEGEAEGADDIGRERRLDTTHTTAPASDEQTRKRSATRPKRTPPARMQPVQPVAQQGAVAVPSLWPARNHRGPPAEQHPRQRPQQGRAAASAEGATRQREQWGRGRTATCSEVDSAGREEKRREEDTPAYTQQRGVLLRLVTRRETNPPRPLFPTQTTSHHPTSMHAALVCALALLAVVCVSATRPTPMGLEPTLAHKPVHPRLPADVDAGAGLAVQQRDWTRSVYRGVERVTDDTTPGQVKLAYIPAGMSVSWSMAAQQSPMQAVSYGLSPSSLTNNVFATEVQTYGSLFFYSALLPNLNPATQYCQ